MSNNSPQSRPIGVEYSKRVYIYCTVYLERTATRLTKYLE